MGKNLSLMFKLARSGEEPIQSKMGYTDITNMGGTMEWKKKSKGG